MSEHIAAMAAASANAHMTPSSSRPIRTNQATPQTPQMQPRPLHTPTYPSPPSRNVPATSPYHPQNELYTQQTLQYTFAAMVQNGMQPAVHRAVPTTRTAAPPTRTAAPQEDRAQRGMTQQPLALTQPQMHQPSNPTYAQALASPYVAPNYQGQSTAANPGQYGQHRTQAQAGYLAQQDTAPDPLLDPRLHPVGFYTSTGQRIQRVPTVPINIDEIVRDYQPKFREATHGVRDWVGQYKVPEDGTRPSGPPPQTPQAQHSAPLTPRSPGSESAASSSQVSSRRRNQFELIFDDSPIHCALCGVGFRKQTDLSHHMRVHKPYRDRPHVCEDCDKRFTYKKDLTRHRGIHFPDAPFACESCDYRAKRKDHLTRHISTRHTAADSVMQSSQSSSRGY